MHPDDNVCLCYRVSLQKIRAYLNEHDPSVASLLSECFGAGTGCQWCVPFLKSLHAQHQRGETPDLRTSPEQYATARKDYQKTGSRDAGVLKAEAAEDDTTQA